MTDYPRPKPLLALTLKERMLWGECPVCHAEHGEPCNYRVGIVLGMTVTGEIGDGVHLGRLQRAPRAIRISVE